MSEHRRLADACARLINAIEPEYGGDTPAAINALADALANPMGCWPLDSLRAVLATYIDRFE